MSDVVTIVPKPANDEPAMSNVGELLPCPCGSDLFNLIRYEGLIHIVCNDCGNDHTENVWTNGGQRWV